LSVLAKLRVLGCSGGIGSGLHTSSYLVNDHLLVDAGTGVTNLTLEEMTRIQHVLITHAHLDHIACLPLLIDSTMELRTEPLTIWASEAVIEVLKAHIFNHHIWPDFAVIPTVEKPFMRYAQVTPYQQVKIGEIEVTPIPLYHAVPTLGYLLKNCLSEQQFMLCGDTTVTDELWQFVNQQDKVVGLAIESAFRAKEEWLAHLAKHLSTNLLLQEIEKLQDEQIVIYVMHLKPSHALSIQEELASYTGRFEVQVFAYNQIVEF
jgi:3',5'-cyclic-nucleotide phosphodiesterase